MKKVLVIAIALTVAFGTMAFARPLTVRVNIPFDFHAGDVLLQAGEYEVSTMTLTQMALILRRSDGHDGVFVPTFPVDSLRSTPTNSISFNRYGEEYFMAGMDNGELKFKLPKSKAERKLAGGENKGTIIAYLIR